MEAALPLELVEFDRSVEETGDVSNMSAEEYLSWVRCQANQLPNVKRVNVDTSGMNRQSKYMPQVEDILQCPVDCLPSDEWQREMLFAFSELRAKLDRLSSDPSTRDRKIAVPPMRDNDAWHRFCFASELGVVDVSDVANNHTSGQVEEPSAETDTAAMNYAGATAAGTSSSDPGSHPDSASATSNEAVRAMMKRKRDLAYQLGITLVKKADGGDTVLSSSTAPAEGADDSDNESTGEASLAEEDAEVAQAWAAAARALHWAGAVDVEPTTSVLLQFDQVLTQRLLGLQIDWLESRDLTAARGRWLYALLARLEKPLYRETAASIRQLYRRCCALRYALSKTSTALAHSSDTTGTSGGDATSSAEAFQSQLALLNMLISICGSYFGQGEEYDAFNYALSAGEGEDGNVEDGNGEDRNDEDGEDDEYWEEDGEEDEVEMQEGAESSAAQGWVAVTTVVEENSAGAVESNQVRAVASTVRKAGVGTGTAMELEEGEEAEENCDSGITASSAKKPRA